MKNSSEHDLHSHLMGFPARSQESLFPCLGPQETVLDSVQIHGKRIARYLNEFWTSRQRQASSIHEVSYRACFKPQLPRFFISLLTAPGDSEREMIHLREAKQTALTSNIWGVKNNERGTNSNRIVVFRKDG